MARMARLVVPHFPHHVTQRGNRRQRTFFSEEDYQTCIELLAGARTQAGVEVWAYCLMPNHVHLVMVPEHSDSLSVFFGDAHRRDTRRINFREKWRGHLWQERFHSFVMDERYLIATVRYTELNPVRAGLCSKPESWAWSSIHAHLNGKDDDLVKVQPMLSRISDWQGYLVGNEDSEELEYIRQHARTGRPVGDNAFLNRLEQLTGRCVRRGRPGPKIRDM